ncbi:MAG: polysaccharide deacetylase family protein [Polyangiaceae bacterium]
MTSPSSTKLCAVSVDLDEVPNYFQIHGLTPSAPAETAVYDVALGRLAELARSEKIPLTLFAVGQDLARRESAAALAAMRKDGHEIANHTLDHRYDLTRLSRDAIAAQIEEGADAIEKAVGVRPVGFRAPGYVITDEVFDVLRELGVQYDSSVFPCPAYNFAKAAAILGIALRGKTSRSVIDTPKMLLAPTRPYRVGTPYWTKGDGIVELPIQVTRGLRLPFIGTTVTLAGPTRAKWLAKMCVGEPLVNLELHGIDVLDASDGLEALRPHQPDVRVAKATKLASLHAVIEVFRDAGYSFVTTEEAAHAFA